MQASTPPPSAAASTASPASTARAPSAEPSGFLTPTPSTPGAAAPPPSSLESRLHPPLPTPRSHTLPPKHNSRLIAYLDNTLLSITRTHTRHHTPEGYSSSAPLALALQKLVDLIWLSNAPSLTVQYLLNIANTFNDFLESYSVTVEALGLCDKLDRCFVQLVRGGTGVRRMDGTERVRVRGVVERGRLHVGGMVSEGRVEEPGGEEDNDDDDEVDWEEEAGRVYVRTLEELGGDLEEAVRPEQWEEEEKMAME